jgi:phosphatidylserine/phosphatidylglycerophosphate/cardiolipin synthase-like enzyme
MLCFLRRLELFIEGWTRYVSELLYIHTKLMIVDDQRVIVCILFGNIVS